MTPSDDSTLIELIAIREKIANCGDGFIIRNTLRQKAASLAAAFVDPTFDTDDAPVAVRDGKAMAADIDDYCGF